MLGLCVYCLCLLPCDLAPCFSVPELLSLCLYLSFLHGILIIFFSKHVSDSVTLRCLRTCLPSCLVLNMKSLCVSISLLSDILLSPGPHTPF